MSTIKRRVKVIKAGTPDKLETEIQSWLEQGYEPKNILYSTVPTATVGGGVLHTVIIFYEIKH